MNDAVCTYVKKVELKQKYFLWTEWFCGVNEMYFKCEQVF